MPPLLSVPTLYGSQHSPSSMQKGILVHTAEYSESHQSPGNKNASNTLETIHSGAFIVELGLCQGNGIRGYFEVIFEHKKSLPVTKEAVSISDQPLPISSHSA